MSKSIQSYVHSSNVRQRIEELLDKRAGQFITSLMSVVNSNPVLQECKPESVVSAAITAAGMDLPINPNLGFAYIIPYNNKKKITETYTDGNGKEKTRTIEKWVMEAQFQMGYKGFIQLAQRSGQFERINSTDVREGELVSEDRLSGALTFKWIDDRDEREKAKIIGYVGYFQLLNGFKKELYMSVEDLKKHAEKYSKSYKKGYGLWVDQFDVMAKKTVLKLMISKYGALSTVLQEAVLADQAAVEEDSYKYVDNEKDEPEDSEKPEEENKDEEKKEDAGEKTDK